MLRVLRMLVRGVCALRASVSRQQPSLTHTLSLFVRRVVVGTIATTISLSLRCATACKGCRRVNSPIQTIYGSVGGLALLSMRCTITADKGCSRVNSPTPTIHVGAPPLSTGKRRPSLPRATHPARRWCICLNCACLRWRRLGGRCKRWRSAANGISGATAPTTTSGISASSARRRRQARGLMPGCNGRRGTASTACRT